MYLLESYSCDTESMKFIVAVGMRGHDIRESLLFSAPRGWWEGEEGERKGIASRVGESPGFPPL